jgi:hypothetical protein
MRASGTAALRSGDPVTRRLVAGSLDRLLEDGPALGRPLADRISGPRLHNLKELRPGSGVTIEVRISVHEGGTRGRLSR